jgi:HEAT repeat protein
MHSPNSQKDELSHQIAAGNSQRAKELARGLPADDVGEVLADMADSRKNSARMLVLDLASQYPSDGSSRAILSRLQDSDLTIRSIAGGLIASIAQKDLTPTMFRLLDQALDLPVKAALARQIGMIGSKVDLTRLGTLYSSLEDTALKNDLALAMARLGDKPSRAKLIQRLSAADASARTAALRDILYVGDPTLARHFRVVLADRRDAFVISLPHDPVVAARVCDVAIQTLDAIGVKLPFATSPMRRFTEEQIKEALQIVSVLERIPAPSA